MKIVLIGKYDTVLVFRETEEGVSLTAKTGKLAVDTAVAASGAAMAFCQLSVAATNANKPNEAGNENAEE